MINPKVKWSPQVEKTYKLLFDLIDSGAQPIVKIVSNEGNEITNNFLFRAVSYKSENYVETSGGVDGEEVYKIDLVMDLDLQGHNTKIVIPEYSNGRFDTGYNSTYFEVFKPKNGIYYDNIFVGTLSQVLALEIVDEKNSFYLQYMKEFGHHESYVKFLETKLKEMIENASKYSFGL